MKTTLSKFALAILFFAGVVFSGCDKDDPLSMLTGLTDFGFKAHPDIPGLENIDFTIDHSAKTITNTEALPYMADVSNLVAEFKAIEFTTVKVGATEQISGVTANDFSNQITYVVTAEDGITTETYAVSVNVSDVNPEGVSWVKEGSGITDMDYQTVKSVFYNGKLRAVFGSIAGNNAVSKYYTSTDGASWTEASITADIFPMGARHELIVHNNKLYICGYLAITDPWGIGFLLPGNLKEIWESTDGETFTKLSSTYTFDGDKVNSNIFSKDNSLWVVGGNTLGFGNPDGTKAMDADFYGPAGLSNRIHNSADLASWEEAEGDTLPAEALRRYSANLVHNDKMFMIGGQISGGYLKDDVWSSTDGKNWTQVSEGGFTARMKAAAISYDGKIWLIGGHTAPGVCSSEVLVSEDDGVSWTPVDDDAVLPAEFTPRAGHSAYLDDDGKVWIVGGYSAATTTETIDGEQVTTETLTPLKDVWAGKLNKLTN